MKRTLTISLDFDWFYRQLLPDTGRAGLSLLRVVKQIFNTAVKQSWQTFQVTFNTSRLYRYHLAASWPTGSMVLWIGVILGGYLIVDIFI